MFARLPLRPAWAQFIGLIVPLAGLLFTAWAAVGLHRTQAARSAQEFQQIADRVNTTIQQRMGQARQALRSARGLMLTTPALDRATFQTYMAAIDIDSQLPGIRGLGYIDRVAATDLPAYIARQRDDGAPDFAVYPAGERDPHYVIRMIEPLARNRRAVGFDVGVEPNRTRALMQAMTSGKATSTAPIVLVQDQSKRQGVLFMLPVYRPGMPIATPAQRTAAFGGVFYMAIVLEELLADLPVVADKRVDIRLHDADSPQAGLLYRAVQGDPDHPSVGLHSETRRLEAGQRTWLVDIRSNTLFERSQDHSAPWILAVGGTLLTALLTLAWWMAISGQRRAENLAAQMTVELERMANVVKLTSNAAIIMDARMQIAWVNEAFTRLYGYTLEEARGQTMGALLGSGHSDPESLTQLDQAALTGNSGRVRVVNRTRDGTLLQIDTEVQAVYGPHGELRYLVELSQDMTAQHRTLQALEAALRETDALLGTIQQHAIVSVTDRNGRITDVNEAFCRLSGYARDELIGQDHRILNSGQQPAAFWAEMWQSISAGRPWRGEICNRAKNGSLHWVDSIIAPVLGSDGQIERFIDIRHDITARKQMELRLRFSQDLLDRTGRIAGVGGWQYEPLNGKLDWSDQNYRIFDLAPGDASRPDDPLAYIPEPGRSALQEAARAAVDAGRAWDMEVPALTAAGRAIWIRAVGEAEFENGVAVRMVGATQDITAQRDARERLDRATQLLRSVLDAATEIAVISTDARLDIVVFNAGAERLLGYRAEEVVGCESPSLFHDPMEVRLRALSMSEELGQPVVGMEVFTHPSVHSVPRDWTFVRKDGSRVPVSLVITPQTAEDGHIMGYVGVAHDITPRLQYEATLRQSMMQAEQVSLAKSQFLANMSHEIRTPMSAILGMLKLLQQTPLTERQREYTSKTEGAARALLALLNDILDFSKVEAGKMVLDRHPFALENVLQDLALMLSANVGIKPVELLFDVDPALLSTRLLGDDLRLLQVLINLGGNAVKFTMVGEVVVSLAQRARTAEQVSVRVAVRDTGIGIAPGALGQIFEGFSQAEASTTRRFGGSGLGLAICRRLVELMGGELQVRSELGQGSEFWFDVDLPIVNEAPPADALPPARHVLVVDDNPCAREVLARQVHSLGWTCELASDADTALAALQQGLASGRPYQVVLLDWRMPGSDGLALTQAIRAAHGRVEGRPDLQIIVMVSAHDREELAQRSGLLPFRIDGYLVKPVTPGLLAEAVGASPSRPRAVDTAAAVPNGAGRLAGLHLLLVEDNPNNRQIAEELLSAEGARIDIAVNGQEGVQAIVAADGNYDAVLMDVQMPVMDGLSAAQRVRELLGARTPPIIAMTAHASEADRAASAAAGMVDHISKPFDLSHLVRVLRHHAGRPEQVAPPPAPPTALPEAVLTVATELGIDIQAAWERLGRRLDVYGRLLALFSEDLREVLPRLDEWWQMGDAGALQAWLHTTKGLSATLGHVRMAAVVAEAAQALQAGGIVAQPPAWWRAMRAAVQDAIPECLRLSAVLAAQVMAPAPTRSGDDAERRLREALPVLLDCLERSDMKALDLYESLQGDGLSCEAPGWRDLCDSMSRLDFPAAAQQVRQAMAELLENQA